MFKHKNALISIAVAMMLAACGGSSDDNDNPNDTGNNTGTPTQPTPADPTPTDPAVEATPDADLTGVADLQFALFEGKDQPVGMSAFTSNKPREANDPFGNINLGGYGAFYFPEETKGENAPIKGFGYSVNFDAQGATELAAVEGRLAFEMRDQNGDNPEILQIQIDKISTSYAAGKLNIEIAPDAKLYVYASDENGRKMEKAVEIPAPGTLLTAVNFPGVGSDSYNFMLKVDDAVKAAYEAATGVNKEILDDVKNFSSSLEEPMAVSLAISNLAAEVDGQKAEHTISVQNSGVNGVIGGGVRGYAQILPRDPA